MTVKRFGHFGVLLYLVKTELFNDAYCVSVSDLVALPTLLISCATMAPYKLSITYVCMYACMWHVCMLRCVVIQYFFLVSDYC